MSYEQVDGILYLNKGTSKTQKRDFRNLNNDI